MSIGPAMIGDTFEADVLTLALTYRAAVFAYKAELEAFGHATRETGDFSARLARLDRAADAARDAERDLCHAATGGRVVTEPTAPGAYPVPVN